MISTRWFKKRILSTNAIFFIASAFIYFFPRYLKSLFKDKSGQRTPKRVKRSYDNNAKNLLKKIDELDFEAYIFGQEEPYDYNLIKDKIIYTKANIGRRKVLNSLELEIMPYLKRGKETIVEFGSGTGRNLLWLKKRYPNINFVGFELSSTSVALSRRVAKKWNIEVEFHEADVTSELPFIPKNTSLVYSVHALEMMPRIFIRALENMLTVARDRVVLFEPIVELYPFNLRGIISRWRAITKDRLLGLFQYTKDHNYKIEKAKRLSASSNPLNETCLLVINKIK